MIIKIIILGFIFFVVWRTFGRLKNNDISRREFLVWLVFWLGVGLAALWPQKTDVIAAWLGVSRGADLLGLPFDSGHILFGIQAGRQTGEA